LADKNEWWHVRLKSAAEKPWQPSIVSRTIGVRRLIDAEQSRTPCAHVHPIGRLKAQPGALITFSPETRAMANIGRPEGVTADSLANTRGKLHL
jgi:hypothetical protein